MKCPSCESTELHEDLTVVGGKRVCANCSWAEGELIPTRAELHEKLQELAELVVRMAVVYDAALRWRVAVKGFIEAHVLVEATDAALKLEANLAREEKLSAN